MVTEKRYRVYIRKADTIVWGYYDTFVGATMAMMAQRLAAKEYPGCATKCVDAAQHATLATYAREMGDRVQL